MRLRLFLAFLSSTVVGCASDKFSVNEAADASAADGSFDASGVDATGDAPEANDAGDKTPFDAITRAALELWLRADDLAPGPVARWTDASPRKHDAITNGTTCTVPTLVEGPTGSNKQVVAFNGTNACMQLSAGFANFTQGLSLLIVARTHPQSGTTTDGFLRLAQTNGASSLSNMILFGRDNATTLRYVTHSPAGVSTGAITVDDGVKDDSWHLYEVFHDAGNAEALVSALFRVDGAPLPSGTVGVPAIAVRDSNLIGKGPSTNLAADIAEIILLSKKLDDPMRNALESYLRAKWRL